MLNQTAPVPRWRSWLVLIISSGGALLSLGGAVLLAAGGGVILFGLAVPGFNTLTLFNMAWALLLVGLLCIPAVVYSVSELRGKTILPRPRRDLFVIASAAMLFWGLLVFLFGRVETSESAWLFLPPLVLLATVLPLWWYIETGRRGLTRTSPARNWGVISTSLLITLPVILVFELFLLLVVLFAGGLLLSGQPGFSNLTAMLERMTNDPNFDPRLFEDLLMGFVQQPGVMVAVLVVVSGVIPLLEELFKPLAVWLYAGDRLTPGQGFLAGMFSGACFALWENLTALSSSGDGSGTIILVARVGTGLLHMVTAGMVSWGLASVWQSRKHLGRLIGAYLLAVTLHGLWNASGVISGFAPMLQFPVDTPNLSQAIETAAIAVLVLLVLVNFILLVYANMRMRREQKTDGLSPAFEAAALSNRLVESEPAALQHQVNEATIEGGNENSANGDTRVL